MNGKPDHREKIRVMIVDDSPAFRWTLRNLLKQAEIIEISGEATNGIEALEIILKSKPDVILMDFEMPLMDGMTALQHLMIHVPTPTIMFSRLTQEGTARCFDALKNGAVDFFCKDNITPGKISKALQDEILERIVCASEVSVKAIEPITPKVPFQEAHHNEMNKIVFCEECGSKMEIRYQNDSNLKDLICKSCGDNVHLDLGNKYIRANSISLLAAGEGAYINLLKIIPQLKINLNGALLIIIDGTVEHVDAFTNYLDAISTINVIRIQDGLTIEGGNCYVGCDNEYIFLKPYSAHYTLKFGKTKLSEMSRPMDITMKSIATVFKNRTAAIFLSGDHYNGEIGVEAILEKGGKVFVLDPKNCLYKNMGQIIIDHYTATTVSDEEELITKIESLDFHFKDIIVTA